MEDRQVTYTLAIDIPMNRETTRAYSPSNTIMSAAVQYSMDRVRNVIRKEGFISLERVFRILELRANPECPHILLTEVSDWTFKNDLLSVFFCHDFELIPVPSKRPDLREIMADEATNIPEEEEEEENWPSSLQKETSGSAENGKTSSDSSRKN